MDDEPDRAYSRAPELQDLVDLRRALGEEGVRYLLIGGFAVVLHGFVRTTKDIDLLVDPADDNVSAIKKALGTLPDNAVSQVEDGDVRRYSVVRVADEIVVDLMHRHAVSRTRTPSARKPRNVSSMTLSSHWPESGC